LTITFLTLQMVAMEAPVISDMSLNADSFLQLLYNRLVPLPKGLDPSAAL
jgi:hypothetical protein